jgi:hypothetical protein
LFLKLYRSSEMNEEKRRIVLVAVEEEGKAIRVEG